MTIITLFSLFKFLEAPTSVQFCVTQYHKGPHNDSIAGIQPFF